MNFFKRIANLFTGGGADDRFLPFYVLNRRCNEPLAGRVDLFNELSRLEEGDHSFYVRKVVHTSGQNRCFSQVEVHLWFDKNKQLVEQEITGGRWLEPEEYEEELARFNAPPEEEEPDEPLDELAETTNTEITNTEITNTDMNRESIDAKTDDGRKLEDEQDGARSRRPSAGDS